MTLNKQETATVLAALRYFQEHREKFLPKFSYLFISDKEIDALCERINTDEPPPTFEAFLHEYVLDELDTRIEMIGEEENGFTVPSTEERAQILTTIEDSMRYDNMYEQINELMDDAIRNVLGQREAA